LKIGVTLALFQSLGTTPVEITELKTWVKEVAVKAKEALRRQAVLYRQGHQLNCLQMNLLQV